MTVAARTTNEAELSNQRRSIQRSATWDRAGIALSGIALLVGALCVIAGCAGLSGRETAHTPLARLGSPRRTEELARDVAVATPLAG